MTHCTYPDCNCPFDAPADPNWCARGLPKSLEKIAERHLRQDLYLFGLKGLLADPAILDHIPAVKALREENERLRNWRNWWCPDVCPITGLPFFMWITHHETDQWVPTYGGPYDSYTIPVRDEDGCYIRECYDHDLGGWRVDEHEDVGVQIVNDQLYTSEEDPEKLKAQIKSLTELSDARLAWGQRLESQLAELQAKYDALMLEFCPDEMTADQLQEWGRNQVPESQLAELREENERLKNTAKTCGAIIHRMTVANQAAWIEWQHGGGAESAMEWVENGLVGPGLIPEDDEPHNTNAQAYFDANISGPGGL